MSDQQYDENFVEESNYSSGGEEESIRSSYDPIKMTPQYHIQEADTALQNLKNVVSEPGWKKEFQHKNGVVVYNKPGISKGDKLPVFMGEHVIDGYTPQSVFAVISMRKLWDDWYEEGSLVENLNETTSLTYMVMQALAGSKTRDLSLVERIECTEEGAIYFVTTSVETSKVPIIANRIRAHIHLNGWILEPLTYDPPKTKLTYVLQTKIKGWVPSILAKTVLSRRPLVMNTIDQYLKKNGPPPIIIESTPPVSEKHTTITMFRFSAFFRSHAVRYSSLSPIHETPADRKPLLMVDYLVDSLHFSKQDAVAVSSKGKLTNLRSPINSDSVLNLLKSYGLDISQIRQIISSAPKILSCKASKTLEPKLKVFQELGLSGSDLVSLIKKNPEIFGYGLHTRIMPGLDLLKKLLGSDEKVIEVINKSRWLYVTTSSMKRLSTNISLLQTFGLSNERIMKFMLGNPEKLMADPKLLQSRLSYVEEKLGISRALPSFIHAASVVLWSSDSEVEKRMKIFKSFGWSDSEISLLFRNQPYVLNKSEGNIREKLEFFMKELGYTPAYLLSCNTFFTLSLNKRVIPRNTMLKILKEKKLVKDKLSLITIATYSEVRFLEFLKGFENDIPGICETYMDNVERVS